MKPGKASCQERAGREKAHGGLAVVVAYCRSVLVLAVNAPVVWRRIDCVGIADRRRELVPSDVPASTHHAT
jgi:hypothetical protein